MSEVNLMMAQLTRVLTLLFCRSISKEFRKPVEILYPELLGDYRSIIRHPMDLGTLLFHCMKGNANISNIREGLSLVFANAIKFNKDSLDMVGIARHLDTFASMLFMEVLKTPYRMKYTNQPDFTLARITSRFSRYEFVRHDPLRDSELFLLVEAVRSVIALAPPELTDALQYLVSSAASAIANPQLHGRLQVSLSKLLLPVLQAASGSALLPIDSIPEFIVASKLPVFCCILMDSAKQFQLSTNSGTGTAPNAANATPAAATAVASTDTGLVASDAMSLGGDVIPAGPHRVAESDGEHQRIATGTVVGPRMSCLPFLHNLDSALGPLLACMTERRLRGCAFSSVWGRPLCCVWVHTPRLPRWPAMILAGHFRSVVHPLLSETNISRLPLSVGRHLLSARPKIVSATGSMEGISNSKDPSELSSSSSSSSSSPAAASSLTTSLPPAPTAIMQQQHQQQQQQPPPPQQQQQQPQQSMPPSPASALPPNSQPKEADFADSRLSVPVGYFLVELFGTHDFGWIKADSTLPFNLDGSLSGPSSLYKACGGETIVEAMAAARWLESDRVEVSDSNNNSGLAQDIDAYVDIDPPTLERLESALRPTPGPPPPQSSSMMPQVGGAGGAVHSSAAMAATVVTNAAATAAANAVAANAASISAHHKIAMTPALTHHGPIAGSNNAAQQKHHMQLQLQHLTMRAAATSGGLPPSLAPAPAANAPGEQHASARAKDGEISMSFTQAEKDAYLRLNKKARSALKTRKLVNWIESAKPFALSFGILPGPSAPGTSSGAGEKLPSKSKARGNQKQPQPQQQKMSGSLVFVPLDNADSGEHEEESAAEPGTTPAKTEKRKRKSPAPSGSLDPDAESFESAAKRMPKSRPRHAAEEPEAEHPRDKSPSEHSEPVAATSGVGPRRRNASANKSGRFQDDSMYHEGDPEFQQLGRMTAIVPSGIQRKAGESGANKSLHREIVSCYGKTLGGCTLTVRGEGVIVARSIQFSSILFRKEDCKLKNRKHILRQELFKIQEKLKALQEIASKREAESAQMRLQTDQALMIQSSDIAARSTDDLGAQSCASPTRASNDMVLDQQSSILLSPARSSIHSPPRRDRSSSTVGGGTGLQSTTAVNRGLSFGSSVGPPTVVAPSATLSANSMAPKSAVTRNDEMGQNELSNRVDGSGEAHSSDEGSIDRRAGSSDDDMSSDDEDTSASDASSVADSGQEDNSDNSELGDGEQHLGDGPDSQPMVGDDDDEDIDDVPSSAVSSQ